MRRLPVYLLLDTSGSMFGEPIEAVRQGMKMLLSDLHGDPLALETAYLSVITFDSQAKQVVPLTDLFTFKEPVIDAGGSTSLGEALELLEKCIDQEVKKSTAEQKGDWKPLIFIFTDGRPTDSWEQAADRIKHKRIGNIIACAAGSGADSALLKNITEIVIELNSLAPDALKAYFKFVSSSIKSTSQSVQQIEPDTPISLPPVPPQIQIVP